MRRLLLGTLLFAVVVGLSVLGHWWHSRSQDEVQLVAEDCDLNMAPCSVVYHGHRIQVQMDRPEGLKPFWIHVRTEGVDLQEPSLQFAMIGMDMEQPMLRLPLFEPGVWQYQAILPVCSSGRSDWVVWLRFRLNGRDVRVELPFTLY